MKRGSEGTNFVLLVILAVVVTIAVGLLVDGLQKVEPSQSPEERLEAADYCDVVYIQFEDGQVIRKSYFLGSTPIMAFGVVWHDDAPTMSLNTPDVVKWLAEVIKVAAKDENPWRFIEIDVLYEHGSGLDLAGTIVIPRARRLENGMKRRLDQLRSQYAVREWLKHGHMEVVSTLRYPRKYTRGFNCEREVRNVND